jgi:hypothetical protein
MYCPSVLLYILLYLTDAGYLISIYYIRLKSMVIIPKYILSEPWETYDYVGFEVLTVVVVKSTIFWVIALCTPLKVNRRFGGTYRLHLQGGRISQARNHLCFPPAFILVSCFAYFSTLKMEATCASETSVDFQRTTRRYIPEDSTLQVWLCWIRSCMNLITLICLDNY